MKKHHCFSKVDPEGYGFSDYNYEIPIVKNSGQRFEWSPIGNWNRRVFVYLGQRQREENLSWEKETSKSAYGGTKQPLTSAC